MTTKRTWTFTLLTAALTVMVATSGPVLTAPPDGKGKPKDDQPPVQYQITLFDVPDTFAKDINNNGAVVGFRLPGDGTESAFLYTEVGGVEDLDTLVDLDALLDPALFDPNLAAFYPDLGPLSLWHARAINDPGQIAGTARDLDAQPTNAWGMKDYLFRLTPTPSTDPNNDPFEFKFLGLPDPDDMTIEAYAINGHGDICGTVWDANGVPRAFVYTDQFIEIAAGTHALDINNAGEVVGFNTVNETAFRYTPGSGTEPFVAPDGVGSTRAYGINDPLLVTGEPNPWYGFTGWTQFVTPKGKNKEDLRAFVYSDETPFIDLGSEQNYYGRDINNFGDVALHKTFGRAKVYLAEFDVIVNLDDAVIDPEAVEWNFGYTIVWRINDGGQIIGHRTDGGTGTGSRGFILTPQ